MHTKFIDFLFISILAIGTGATVYLISTSKKISSVLLAGATSATAGVYIVRSKTQLESKLDNLIAFFDSNKTSVKLDKIDPSFHSTRSHALLAPSSSGLDLEIAVQERTQVIQWLESLGITVNNYYQAQSSDYIYDRLTITLGDNYQYLEKLYQQIKRKLSTGGSFKFKLSGQDQQQICQNTSFCSQLYEYTFLATYRYISASKTIVASPNRKGEVINFFSGQWFERFIYLKISQLLSHHELDYQCLLNPEIITPDGHNFELDIVFLVEGKPLWIECKTGQYQNYIHKYSEFRKTLKIEKERSFLVILGLSDRLASGLTQMYDLMVTNENLFVQDINKIFSIKSKQSELAAVNFNSQRRTIKIKPKTIQNKDELLTVLKKAKLRPSPEWRKTVLLNLIEIVAPNNYSPQLLKELKEKLFLLVTGVSKTILIDILNTLIMAESLLDSEAKPLYSYQQNLASLVKDNIDGLEQKCLESYALIALLTDPDYFAAPANLEDFKTVTGATNLDHIDLLKIQTLAQQINHAEDTLSTVNFLVDR